MKWWVCGVLVGRHCIQCVITVSQLVTDPATSLVTHFIYKTVQCRWSIFSWEKFSFKKFLCALGICCVIKWSYIPSLPSLSQPKKKKKRKMLFLRLRMEHILYSDTESSSYLCKYLSFENGDITRISKMCKSSLHSLIRFAFPHFLSPLQLKLQYISGIPGGSFVSVPFFFFFFGKHMCCCSEPFVSVPHRSSSHLSARTTVLISVTIN